MTLPVSSALTLPGPFSSTAPLSAFSQLPANVAIPPETVMFACTLAWYLDLHCCLLGIFSELAQEAWSLYSVGYSPYLAS